MYKYLNVNPENRKESDCVVRAISLATDSDYYLVEKLLLNIGDIYSCDELCLQCYNQLLSGEIGYTRYNGKGKTVEEISESHKDKILLIRIDGHLTCSMFGTIFDIWDCTKKICDVFWIVE